MAGTIKYLSKVDTDYDVTVTIEYNTGDAVPIIWQEGTSFSRDRLAGFTSAAQLHTEVILPEAELKIKGRRALKVASDAAQTAITNATVYNVPNT